MAVKMSTKPFRPAALFLPPLLLLLLAAGLLLAVGPTKADELQTQQSLLAELEYDNEVVSLNDPWATPSPRLADWISRARPHFSSPEQANLMGQLQYANDEDPRPWASPSPFIRNWVSEMRATLS